MNDGYIKCFDVNKGYGFITSGDLEIFFHKTSIIGHITSIMIGKRVTFDLYEVAYKGRLKYEAKNVTLT